MPRHAASWTSVPQFAAAAFVALLAPALPLLADATPHATPRDTASWHKLLQDLNAPDAPTRRAAQSELASIPPADAPTLQQLAAQSPEPEVKIRLARRLAEIADEQAISPPPLSFHVHDASLADLAAALQKVTGTPIDLWNNDTSVRFSLDASGQSFWSLFTQLSAQHPLRFENINGLRLESTPAGFRRAWPAPGGFAVFPEEITRSRSADLQRPPGQQLQPEQMRFSFTVAADPRIQIFRYSHPSLFEVLDDRGNNLLDGQRTAFDDHSVNDNSQHEILFPGSASLAVPPTLGTRIATARGSMFVTIQLAQDVVTLNDPDSHLRHPFLVAGRHVTLSSFSVQNQNFTYDIAAESPRSLEQAASGERLTPITMQVLDADNHPVWSTPIWGNSSGNCGSSFKPPLHLRFSCPTRTRDITLHFTLKNIPLP